MKTQICNKQIDEKIFREIRKEVLTSWPTGKQVNFEASINFHRYFPKNKVSAIKLAQGKKRGITFVQPRAGVALVEKQIDLLKALEEAGADFLPVTIDSYTRHNKYRIAEKEIQKSRQLGISTLNGFPAVNYGVWPCRKIIETFDAPVEIRHGSPDARLLAEITLAAGFTDFEGGGISYNIPYSKLVSLDKSIFNWQYVDRLVGCYQENKVIINRESFGALTGTLVPPCVSIAISVIEALLAAEQGVKSITLGYGQGGNLIQDVAAVKVLVSLAEEYLQNFGYKKVLITTAFHQWMGGFPENENQAAGVIAWGAVAGAFAKADKIICKSTHEAVGVPTKEANILGIKITKQIVNMLKDQKFPFNEPLEEEMEIITEETKCILIKAFELGKGDIARGTVLAFEKGVIDLPFAPSRYTLKKVIPVRDNNGAIRLLDTGNLPFTGRIIAFHKAKISERAKRENRPADYDMVEDDIFAVANGMLVGRPGTRELYEDDED